MSTLYLAVLVEFEFSTGTERYWTGYRPLSWDGETWQPTGNLGEMSALESSEDDRANGLTLKMAGLPPNAFSGGTKLRAENYKGRKARVVLAVMDATFSTVTEAFPRVYGIDQMTYAVDPSEGGSVEVVLENELLLAARRRQRLYSNPDQQAEFAGDKGFEFMQYLSSGVEVKWGTSGAFFKG